MYSLKTQVGGDHYKTNYQVVQLCEKYDIRFIPGCAIKYVTRYKKKDGLKDLKKAKHYCEMALDFRIRRKSLLSIEEADIENYGEANSLTSLETNIVCNIIKGNFGAAIALINSIIVEKPKKKKNA